MEHLPEASTGLPSAEGVPPHSLNLDSRPPSGTEGQRRGVTGGQRTHVCLTTESSFGPQKSHPVLPISISCHVPNHPPGPELSLPH